VQPVVTDLDAVKRSGWREQHILVISDQNDDGLPRAFIHQTHWRASLWLREVSMAKTEWTTDDVAARFSDAAHTSYRFYLPCVFGVLQPLDEPCNADP